MRLRRIVCRIWGCNGDEISCERCRAYTYKPGYVGSGILREISIRARMSWCRLDRLVCRLIGCNDLDADWHGCARCGADIYDSDFVQNGPLIVPFLAIRRLYYRLKYVFFPRKCQLCGKTMTRDKYGFWDCETDDADHIPF